MSTETKSALATAFAILALLVALASSTVSGITAIHASDSIQTQRLEAVVANCRDVNQRHDNTIKQIDDLIAKLPKDRQARAEAGRASTVLLIDALTPKRPDCRAYADSIVHP